MRDLQFVRYERIGRLPELLLYRIRGNFRGSYISRITCQEDFRVLIFADDLPLNDYTALDYCLLI